MANSGSPKVKAHVHALRGTVDPRTAEAPVVAPIEGRPERPKTLRDAHARRMWNKKVDDFIARGQVVRGCEETLAAYCNILSEIAELTKRRVSVPAAMYNQQRMFAIELYDTPSAQTGKVQSGAPNRNPFTAHGRKPRA